jgi:hypothetical protein
MDSFWDIPTFHKSFSGHTVSLCLISCRTLKIAIGAMKRRHIVYTDSF